jgi:two-component system CheB/CheR fusion protein
MTAPATDMHEPMARTATVHHGGGTGNSIRKPLEPDGYLFLGASGLPASLAELRRVRGPTGSARSHEMDLAEIVNLELQAVGSGEKGKISVAGPPVPPSLEMCRPSPALHELATGATNYGALKEAAGRPSIESPVGCISGGKHNLIPARQENGAEMPPLENLCQGYGRQLIDQLLADAPQAKAKLVFGADGVFRRIGMPLRFTATRNPMRQA